MQEKKISTNFIIISISNLTELETSLIYSIINANKSEKEHFHCTA